MATRIGIELSPDACRIVEIDPAPARERRRGATRVRSFAVLPPLGPETEAKLRSLRKRDVAVVVWTAASDHRQVEVAAGSYGTMRAEAIQALDAAGVETRGVWVDIAPAAKPAQQTARRRVVVTLASGAELTAALQPLVDAGIRVRTVVTPAAALSSLARLRRESWTPDAFEVFVALEERATCVALMRGGALVAARDLAWGYVDELGSGLEPRGREDIAAGLMDAIGDLVAATGGAPRDIKQVCVCGGHPELRSITAPLIEKLDVELEPLDSLFGIDGDRLPEPVDEFRERAAELRLAWAAAADSPPIINLLRARHRQETKTMLARAAVVAGVAAGLGIGWRVQSLPRWRSIAPAAAARPAATISPDSTPAPSAAATSTPPPILSAPVAANRMPPVVLPPPVRVTTRTSPAVAALSVAATTVPPAVPAQRTIVPPPVAPRQEPRQPPAISHAQRPPAARTTDRPAQPAPDVALPFEAVIGTILYSPGRKLAIIDGRVVGPGDEVRGARIVDITPGTVILEDRDGRLRTLTVAVGAR